MLGHNNGGVVSGNEFIDTIRFRDWLQIRMQERLAALLTGTDKIPYTDDGIARIEGQVRRGDFELSSAATVNHGKSHRQG